MNDRKQNIQPPILLRDHIQQVLTRVRPYIQNDGGDIELVDVVGNRAHVRLTGRCVECPSAVLTLHLGIEMAIKEACPEFEGLVSV